jgi:hypothetical protein
LLIAAASHPLRFQSRDRCQGNSQAKTVRNRNECRDAKHGLSPQKNSGRPLTDIRKNDAGFHLGSRPRGGYSIIRSIVKAEFVFRNEDAVEVEPAAGASIGEPFISWAEPAWEK